MGKDAYVWMMHGDYCVYCNCVYVCVESLSHNRAVDMNFPFLNAIKMVVNM